jgi:hypothetical protein
MKGLDRNCCYIIDHYFYYPNKYGSHDSCCLAVLMDVVICNGKLDTGIREAAGDIVLQLREREHPWDSLPDQIFDLLGGWNWKKCYPANRPEEPIENFIRMCRKNRLQQKPSVV